MEGFPFPTACSLHTEPLRPAESDHLQLVMTSAPGKNKGMQREEEKVRRTESRTLISKPSASEHQACLKKGHAGDEAGHAFTRDKGHKDSLPGDAQPSAHLSSWALCIRAQSHQSCPILCDPMDHGPQGSSVHGILRARILEWVAISFSSDKV